MTLPRIEVGDDVARCRGCGRALRGKPYWAGGPAYHPRTGEQCKVTFYGGYVCSWDCDRRSSLELERSMPGHSSAKQTISQPAQASLDRNWS